MENNIQQAFDFAYNYIKCDEPFSWFEYSDFGINLEQAKKVWRDAKAKYFHFLRNERISLVKEYGQIVAIVNRRKNMEAKDIVDYSSQICSIAKKFQELEAYIKLLRQSYTPSSCELDIIH